MKNICHSRFLLAIVCSFVAWSDYSEAFDSGKGWERVFADNLSSIIPLHHYREKSYFMAVHFHATFFEALNFCEQIHMKLLTIRSADENNRILKYIREASKGNDYWTAGTRLVDGYSFLWLPQGERVEYTNWANGEPSDVNEKCLQVLVKGGRLEWNDKPCDHRLPFICERYNNQLSTVSILR
ncbi:hypothetical protein JTB14_003958 [Gonioctena quinquepunctata]|nr:hypothetical protein JTB14_003958 [Gonioctena quinquepunctata]